MGAAPACSRAIATNTTESTTDKAVDSTQFPVAGTKEVQVTSPFQPNWRIRVREESDEGRSFEAIHIRS
jgi:hypothetical protein